MNDIVEHILALADEACDSGRSWANVEAEYLYKWRDEIERLRAENRTILATLEVLADGIEPAARALQDIRRVGHH